jgi:hypothetical protein
VVAVGLLLEAVGSASAVAAPSIEGIWSFGGGQIGVQRTSNDTYNGFVVAETTFAACPHPVGQEIWKGFTQQPDGSYWGLHQWYAGPPPNCTAEKQGGPTAWRVMTEPDGSYYLRVCFSRPGSSQPTIAPNGDPKAESEYAAYHVTYGCYRSTLISLLPVAPGEPGASSSSGTSGSSGSSSKSGVESFKETLTLPNNKQCLSGRLFKIHLRNPKYDPFKSVTIKLRGRKLKSSRQGKYVVATVDLKGLPKSAFTIHVSATTVLGHHLAGRRTYHTCIPKLKPKRFKKHKSV